MILFYDESRPHVLSAAVILTLLATQDAVIVKKMKCPLLLEVFQKYWFCYS